MTRNKALILLLPFLTMFFFVTSVASVNAELCSCTYGDGNGNCSNTIDDASAFANQMECQVFCEGAHGSGSFGQFIEDDESEAGINQYNDCDIAQEAQVALEEAGATPSTGTPSRTPREFITPILSVDIPGVSFSQIIETNGKLSINFIGEYVTGVYKYLLGVSTIVAIVFVMVGGFQYVLAAGRGDVGEAKKRITNAITGLVLLMSVYLILYTVNPNLVFFGPLKIDPVPFVHIPNETPDPFEDYDFEIVSRPGNGGVGWNNVPMYDQTSYDSVSYGVCGTVKTSGCGATSFAMAASSLGASLTPETVATIFAEEGYRICGDPPGNSCENCSGTHANAYSQSRLLKENGLRGRWISKNDQAKIEEVLHEGHPIIISYRTKTGGGHYVVLTGFDEEGKVLVNNPWEGKMERRTMAQIMGTIKSAVYLTKE